MNIVTLWNDRRGNRWEDGIRRADPLPRPSTESECYFRSSDIGGSVRDLPECPGSWSIRHLGSSRQAAFADSSDHVEEYPETMWKGSTLMST